MKNILTDTNELIPMDGLVYSSIERDFKEFNMIYTPEHARENYFIVEIHTFEVVAVNKTNISVLLRRKGIPDEKKGIEEGFKNINWDYPIHEIIVNFPRQ